MARPKVALLSRDVIASKAIDIVESGRDLQIVTLARELGVSPSSLYHHVDGRDGIIHAMRESLSTEYAPPSVAGLPWQEQVRVLINTLWRLYSDHPRTLQLLLTVIIEEPETLELYGDIAAALRLGGVPDDELLVTIETLDAFAFGSALDALSPESIFARNKLHPSLDALIDKHPTGKARNEQLFTHGVDLILTSVELRAERARIPGDH